MEHNNTQRGQEGARGSTRCLKPRQAADRIAAALKGDGRDPVTFQKTPKGYNFYQCRTLVARMRKSTHAVQAWPLEVLNFHADGKLTTVDGFLAESRECGGRTRSRFVFTLYNNKAKDSGMTNHIGRAPARFAKFEDTLNICGKIRNNIQQLFPEHGTAILDGSGSDDTLAVPVYDMVRVHVKHIGFQTDEDGEVVEPGRLVATFWHTNKVLYVFDHAIPVVDEDGEPVADPTNEQIIRANDEENAAKHGRIRILPLMEYAQNRGRFTLNGRNLADNDSLRSTIRAAIPDAAGMDFAPLAPTPAPDKADFEAADTVYKLHGFYQDTLTINDIPAKRRRYTPRFEAAAAAKAAKTTPRTRYPQPAAPVSEPRTRRMFAFEDLHAAFSADKAGTEWNGIANTGDGIPYEAVADYAVSRNVGFNAPAKPESAIAGFIRESMPQYDDPIDSIMPEDNACFVGVDSFENRLGADSGPVDFGCMKFRGSYDNLYLLRDLASEEANNDAKRMDAHDKLMAEYHTLQKAVGDKRDALRERREYDPESEEELKHHVRAGDTRKVRIIDAYNSGRQQKAIDMARGAKIADSKKKGADEAAAMSEDGLYGDAKKGSKNGKGRSAKGGNGSDGKSRKSRGPLVEVPLDLRINKLATTRAFSPRHFSNMCTETGIKRLERAAQAHYNMCKGEPKNSKKYAIIVAAIKKRGGKVPTGIVAKKAKDDNDKSGKAPKPRRAQRKHSENAPAPAGAGQGASKPRYNRKNAPTGYTPGGLA